MLDDWVLDTYTGKPMRVSCVNINVGKGLEPIPLTPEILEKNGWQHDPSLQRAMVNCNYQPGNYIGMEWDSKYHCLDIKIRNRERLYPYNIPELRLIIPCDYVHELQHCLKLCGIDKTIVL